MHARNGTPPPLCFSFHLVAGRLPSIIPIGNQRFALIKPQVVHYHLPSCLWANRARWGQPCSILDLPLFPIQTIIYRTIEPTFTSPNLFAQRPDYLPIPSTIRCNWTVLYSIRRTTIYTLYHKKYANETYKFFCFEKQSKSTAKDI